MTAMGLEISHTLLTVALAAALVGGLAGVLGCFLVLRGQSLLGDVIAHAALPGVVGAFLIAGQRSFVVVLAGALASGLLAALAVQGLRRLPGVKPDAALGAVLSLFFAGGVVLLSVAQMRPGSAGLGAVLFGQAASVLRADLVPMAVVAGLVLAVLLALWKEFQLLLFDPLAARAQGLPVAALEALLALLVATAIVLGLTLAGAVLMVALLIAPAVAARQWVHRLAPMVGLAALLGAGAGVVGATVSARVVGLATGPVMVLAAMVPVILSLALAPGRGLIARAAARARGRRSLGEAQVLGAMAALGRDHADPAYPSEEAMLDAGLGAPARPVLTRLARAGLVAEVAHNPETTPHWALTRAGQSRAEDARAGPAPTGTGTGTGRET
jgi:manganese/zinc/iron transport system permease protein